MWIGDVEGATLAMGLRKNWTATWFGGAAGLVGGAVAGWCWMTSHPTTDVCHSSRARRFWVLSAGALMVPALGLYPSAPDLKDADAAGIDARNISLSQSG